MPLGGDELRVIILCHLGYTPLQFFLRDYTLYQFLSLSEVNVG